MARTLGIITIGQAPRDDIADLFAQHAPPGTKVLLRGALDGMSEAEIDAVKPRSSARNGRGRAWRSSPRRWRPAPMPARPTLPPAGWPRRSPISWRWIA